MPILRPSPRVGPRRIIADPEPIGSTNFQKCDLSCEVTQVVTSSRTAGPTGALSVSLDLRVKYSQRRYHMDSSGLGMADGEILCLSRVI